MTSKKVLREHTGVRGEQEPQEEATQEGEWAWKLLPGSYGAQWQAVSMLLVFGCLEVGPRQLSPSVATPTKADREGSRLSFLHCSLSLSLPSSSSFFF